MSTRQYRCILFAVWSILLVCSMPAVAGFLEMPEIREAPDVKRGTLLRDLDIPSVRERDPDPQAGPRIAVTEFRLQGIVDYPEFGIHREEISELVENIRFDLMDEKKRLESGFTLEELAAISDMLVEIEEDTLGKDVGPLEVQKLVWLVRDQLAKRGVTLGMIETVADTITRYYRERGFILAKAYIPQQEVRDGVVTLTLLLGVLGDVKANNSNLYKEQRLTKVFDDLLMKPVRNDLIEERLFLINDYPGVTVQGFFEPGSQVGDTLLNLNVVGERRFDANMRLDNHGSEQTGELRFYAEAFWHNPSGHADQLLLGILYAAEPTNTTYGQLRYSSNLGGPRIKFSVGGSTNDFVLGPGNVEDIDFLELEGETEQFDISGHYVWKRGRKSNLSFDLVFEEVESVLRSRAFPVLNERLDLGGDEIRNITLAFNFDILQESARLLHQGNGAFTSGEFLSGADVNAGQDEKYNIISGDYRLLTFWRLPFAELNTRVIVRAAVQIASSALSSISQFSLGGPTRARGFTVNQFSADDAIYTGVDWIFYSPKWFLNQYVQPFLFADIAYGEAELVGLTGELSDIGFGLQFSPVTRFRGSMHFAFPLTSNFSSADIAEPDDSVRLYFDMQYSF